MQPEQFVRSILDAECSLSSMEAATQIAAEYAPKVHEAFTGQTERSWTHPGRLCRPSVIRDIGYFGS